MTRTTMTGATAHPLVQKIMAYQAAMAAGDPDAGSVFAPDVQYTVPGQNALSGSYRGSAAVMGYFGKLMQLTAGSYAIDRMNWLVCDEKVILETVNRATLRGAELVWDEAILFYFRNGLKTRIEMFQADQAAVDAFFGPP
jgi:ketosteroid isomerase-like protein